MAGGGAGRASAGRLVAMVTGKLGRRMLSMEKLRFLVGGGAWGLRRRMSAASSMSVGVGGGEETEEEKEVERRERGEEGRWGEKREGGEEAGESHTRMMGDAASCLSSFIGGFM